MRPRLALFLLLLLAPFAAPGTLHAQPAGPQPLDRLLPEIRRNHPGQFLDAEDITRDGSPGYRLKWLTPEGRVMWLDADARTGRVTGGRPDRDEGFNRRENAPPTDGPRGNFRQPPSSNFMDGEPRSRFGDRFGPRPDFNADRFNQNRANQERSMQDRERFGRPPMGEGGFRNPAERFGRGSDDERRGGWRGRRGGGEN